ncbi:MAG: mechanosensitive ion channel [Ignisphaera sp.]|uniref:Mechanosensitive ion channel n=2 Tax=Ignisphaera aggregans TaxID=334771 RepID=A0A832EV94_9CREN
MESGSRENISSREIARNAFIAIASTIMFIVLYVVVSALVKFVISDLLLTRLNIDITGYEIYIQLLLALMFGYLIVNSVAWFFYWSTRPRYGHSTAVAVRNVVRIIGVGAMVAAIAGGVAGGVAGVALGGFLGMVIGFASQQVLGQAVAGLFVLISRPFRIGDEVIVAGEEGVVDDVSTMFTVIKKSDGSRVLIPNTTIIGGKIYIKPKK